jgi:hypothetical protein
MAQASRVFPARTVTAFPAVFSSENYTKLPEQSWVAVTDVANSTEAIGQGRYKDVNLAGAAGIAAFVNAFPALDLPFTFGGDGAAILIPPGAQDQASIVLSGLQDVAEKALGLRLRTALIPVDAIRKAGFDVRIAYQELQGGRSLTMVSGGGTAYAETLTKSAAGEPFQVKADKNAPPPSFEGLSCRWQPVLPQRGLMLSVLVQGPSEPESYASVFDALAYAAAGPQSPLSKAPIPSWPPKGLAAEVRLRAPGKPWRYALGVLGQSALSTLSGATGITIGGFDGRRYRESLASHCDALKFADGLKMVVDCTPAEAEAVEAVLDALPQEEGFAFGVQKSSAALMTCFVQTTADAGHIHFIDGSDGGYALAARQLKNRAPGRV